MSVANIAVRRRVHVELRAERGVRDRHDEAGRHSVARRVAEENREPSVRQRHEVVDVAADHVGDLVVGAELEARGSRELLRDQARLELAGELELVAVVDLVDELHREQQQEQAGGDVRKPLSKSTR